MINLSDNLDYNYNFNFMLILALILILFYEIVNGFHDTANAIFSIIYTRTLKAKTAVIMSGIFNFMGVLTSGLSVAYAIVHLLPINLLIDIGSKYNLSMIFTILITTILWNVSTWYLSIPSSSSHTLIGAIIGVNIINSIINKLSLMKLFCNPKLTEIFISLITSPIIGFILSSFFILLINNFFNKSKNCKNLKLTASEHKKLTGKTKPPFWIRVSLIISAAGVSFFHGANDGQKGLGIIMLILIGIAPESFVINLKSKYSDINKTYNAIYSLKIYYKNHEKTLLNIIKNESNEINNNNKTLNEFIKNKLCYNEEIFNIQKNKKYTPLSYIYFTLNKSLSLLYNTSDYTQLKYKDRLLIKNLYIYISNINDKIIQSQDTNINDRNNLIKLNKDLLYTIEYAPLWIIIIVATALSIGTMIGWRRVVKTIGEKINKKQITYAQGLSTQVTTTISIGMASLSGMPVSTTHIVSSAMTGAVFMSGDKLQKKTIKNIFITWILTIPISIIVSGILYYFLIKLI